jgi:hypothetical protein
MPTRVLIKGAKPGRGLVMVQAVDPANLAADTADFSPVIIPEGEEREFYVDGSRALLVTEHAAGQPQTKKRR